MREKSENCASFRARTSYQSNGFVEAVRRHIEGLARCYQTQIETMVCSFQRLPQFHSIRSSSRRICALNDSQRDPMEKRHSYFCWVLHAHLLCAYLVNQFFALIPDHELRAAKFTNREISGCWCGRDALSDEHLVVRGLVCLSADQCRKPLGEQKDPSRDG